MRILGSVVAAATLVLAGCDGGTEPAEPTAASSPTPLGDVGTVLELKDAAVAAGYECPSWTQDDRVAAAAQSGTCSDADVFTVWTNEEAKQAMIGLLKSLGDASLLVGPNWVINGEDAPALQEELGGTVVTGSG